MKRIFMNNDRKPDKSAPRHSSVLVVAVMLLAAPAFAQAPFYQGKTITMVASTAPGGTGDLRVKAMVPTLRKHIPGNPTIIIEYMDGGGGRKGANYLYRNAKPDGLTIGALSGGIVGLQIMRESGVMYDIDKFIQLGSPESVNHYTIYTRKELGANNIEKLRSLSGIRIGAQSVGHVSYIAGRLFAYLFGLKQPQFIAGYTAPEVDAALLRGELDGRANNAASVLRRNPDWLDKGDMDFHSILEVPKGIKHAKLGHLPEIESFAKNDKEKKLVAMWRGFRLVGSPYMLPPGTPKDRVDVLEDAFRKTYRDTEFRKDFLKLVGDDAEPMMPEELAKVIREIPRDAEVVELLRSLAGARPLPAR
ncbi:MAG: Bug family tripartite tricarboxylate transporter substrate binding protein [Candidatus Binatia bacterium]